MISSVRCCLLEVVFKVCTRLFFKILVRGLHVQKEEAQHCDVPLSGDLIICLRWHGVTKSWF